MLVDLVGHFDSVAPDDVLAVDIQLTSPLALVVPLESAVGPRTKMEVGCRYRSDPIGVLGPVGEHSTDRAAQQATVVIPELQVGTDVMERIGPPLGEFDSSMGASGGPPLPLVVLVVDEEGEPAPSVRVIVTGIQTNIPEVSSGTGVASTSS